MAAHAVVAVVVIAASGGGRPVHGVDVGNGETGTVLEIDLADDAPVPAAPAPAAATSVTMVAVPRRPLPQGLEIRRAARAPKLPPVAAITSDSPSKVAAPPLVPEPIEVAPPAAVTEAAPAPPAESKPAAPAPAAAPVYVPAEVASYLRAQDFFPSLPDSLRREGARYQANLDICVSREGRVVGVGSHTPAPALDTALQAAVRSWRYRPLLVGGTPAPFCHRMTVSYQIM